MPESPFNVRLLIDAIVLLIYFFGIVALGLWAGPAERKPARLLARRPLDSRGGRCLPRSSRRRRAQRHSSARPPRGSRRAATSTASSSSARSSRASSSRRLSSSPYYDYRVQSIYEFLTVRFGTKTKNMASGIFLFTRVLGIGVRLYLGGAIMVVIWRYLFPTLPVNLNTYVWGIVFVTVLTTFYTAVGGIKAVVWTDLIQAVLMIASVLFAIFLLIRAIPGGLATVQQNLGGVENIQFFQSGWNSELAFGPALKGDVRGAVYAPGGVRRFHAADHGYAWHRPGHGAADVDRAELPQVAAVARA
jgi:hypothetical protein